jgi:hypothetical protein
MDLLKPDLGKAVYLLIGFFVAPKLLKMVKR